MNFGIRHRDLIQCIGFKTSIFAAACATIFFKYRKESLFIETQLKPVGQPALIELPPDCCEALREATALRQLPLANVEQMAHSDA